uniref:RRM domain-containing protein n=1 Tax=Salix viminalis TaxID=40686 RepID=A0A6N2MJT0_SALVM
MRFSLLLFLLSSSLLSSLTPLFSALLIPASSSVVVVVSVKNIRIQRDNGQSKTAFVTFKDPKALEIALLLSLQYRFMKLDFLCLRMWYFLKQGVFAYAWKSYGVPWMQFMM